MPRFTSETGRAAAAKSTGSFKYDKRRAQTAGWKGNKTQADKRAEQKRTDEAAAAAVTQNPQYLLGK